MTKPDSPWMTTDDKTRRRLGLARAVDRDGVGRHRPIFTWAFLAFIGIAIIVAAIIASADEVDPSDRPVVPSPSNPAGR